MQKLKLWMPALLFVATAGFADIPLSIEITNTGWVTPLYTSAFQSNVMTLLNRSFLYTELSPQMTKHFSVIVGRLDPPPPEKLQINFYDSPDLQGEPVAKWGYFDMENPITGKWEAKLCDIYTNKYITCIYTGDRKAGYFIYITVDGDMVRSIP